jgi:DNA-binding MarR family transcriptional regulator
VKATSSQTAHIDQDFQESTLEYRAEKSFDKRDDQHALAYNLLFASGIGDKLLNNLDEVLVALRRVIRATDIHSKRLAKTTGLTAPQILLLQTIKDKGEMTIGDLAGAMSLSQATVTTILDRLEKRQLVFRERSTEDKRKVHAHLTDKALETLKEAPTPLQEQFARRFASLDEWERSMIIASLQRVARMMDAEDIDASPVLDLGDLNRHDHQN